MIHNYLVFIQRQVIHKVYLQYFYINKYFLSVEF